MKGMKSSKVDVLEKKVNALINVVKQILDENAYLKDLSVGTLETVKQFKEYDKAIEKLKEKVAEEASEAEKAKALGEIIKQNRLYGQWFFNCCPMDHTTRTVRNRFYICSSTDSIKKAMEFSCFKH